MKHPLTSLMNPKAEPAVCETVKKLRQFDVISPDCSPELEKIFNSFGWDTGDDWVAIILTHTCSLINSDIEKEPNVECILARRCDTIDPALTGRKNPRKLHLELLEDEASKNYELNIVERIFFGKIYLKNIPESRPLQISDENQDLLTRWIIARYNAPVFPDEFNKRFKSNIHTKIENKLKRSGEHIVGLFIQIEPRTEELDEEIPYEIRFMILRDEEITQKNIEGIEAVRKEIEVFFKEHESDGIELIGSIKTVTESEITLSVYRQYDLLLLDYLSERERPGGSFPQT